jgi:hypothetical protein
MNMETGRTWEIQNHKERVWKICVFQIGIKHILLWHTDSCAHVIAQIDKLYFSELGSWLLYLLFGGFALIRDILNTATYTNILIVQTIALRIDFHSNKQVCIAQPLHSFFNIWNCSQCYLKHNKNTYTVLPHISCNTIPNNIYITIIIIIPTSITWTQILLTKWHSILKQQKFHFEIYFLFSLPVVCQQMLVCLKVGSQKKLSYGGLLVTEGLKYDDILNTHSQSNCYSTWLTSIGRMSTVKAV